MQFLLELLINNFVKISERVYAILLTKADILQNKKNDFAIDLCSHFKYNY